MKKIVVISILAILILCVICASFYYLKNQKKNEVKVENIAPIEKTSFKTMDEINQYQKRYFEIVKRHNALLAMEMNGETTKDLKELKDLFDEVKTKINPDCKFLNEYLTLKEKYKQNLGNNTLEMNEFAIEKYKAFDKLLNETYSEAKSKLNEEDFEQLKLSQRAWLNEVEAYNKVFEKQNFGTIATLIKTDYEINMRAFRTLLLMLYL